MNGFTELAIIFGIAAFFGVIARKFKQPEILGFIFAGVFISSFLPVIAHNSENLELFSKIGIAFLLFIVGLELNIADIKKLGVSALSSAIGQVLITSFLAFGVSLLIGFNFVESIFIAICLTFSSTIVVVKLFSQKKEIDTLHGKLTTVFLIVQDFAAIAVMIGLSTVANLGSSNVTAQIISLIGKSIFILLILIVATRFVLPFLLKFVNKERETLFISIIAWALAFSALVGSDFIGFSVEIGALLAGISLSDRYEHLQIESWMKPLRDFFLTLFFVLLGLKVSVGAIDSLIVPIIVFSLFVLVIKPLIVMILLGSFKYNKRVSFYSGISLGQISEFSLLVVAIGVTSNYVSASLLTLITLVGGITMILSSYMVVYNAWFYDKFKNFLFFAKNKTEDTSHLNEDGYTLLLGCHRIGKNILDYLVRNGDKVVVVDNNPIRIESLKKAGIKTIMGDVRDFDFLESLKFEKAKYVISTVPGFEINESIMQKINILKEKPATILLAKEEEEVPMLYNIGADYVVYPYLLTGQKVNMILKSKRDIDQHKISTMKTLLSSRAFGK